MQAQQPRNQNTNCDPWRVIATTRVRCVAAPYAAPKSTRDYEQKNEYGRRVPSMAAHQRMQKTSDKPPQ